MVVVERWSCGGGEVEGWWWNSEGAAVEKWGLRWEHLTTVVEVERWNRRHRSGQSLGVGGVEVVEIVVVEVVEVVVVLVVEVVVLV